uniref:Reverse transcriptase zinc-binding domain-containing protein n=1 Tax=Cannabis sativa TaxID=3483 RepID=A0A803P8K7_CANSA
MDGVGSNLITEDRQWDVSLLNQWFSPPDVDRILTIPLGFFRHNDTLVSHNHSSGVYSVQTGYHYAASLEDIDSNSCSSSTKQWWKFFWLLQLSQKIRIFAWRAYNDELHVATAFVKRKSITNATCSICHQAWESIGHALFGCKYVRAVWRHSNRVLDLSKASTMQKGDYLVHLSTIFTRSEME